MQGSNSWHCLGNTCMKWQRTTWIKASPGDSLKQKLAFSLTYFSTLKTSWPQALGCFQEKYWKGQLQWTHAANESIRPLPTSGPVWITTCCITGTPPTRRLQQDKNRAVCQVQLSRAQVSSTKLRWNTSSIIYLPDLSLYLYQLKQLENKINV